MCACPSIASLVICSGYPGSDSRAYDRHDTCSRDRYETILFEIPEGTRPRCKPACLPACLPVVHLPTACRPINPALIERPALPPHAWRAVRGNRSLSFLPAVDDIGQMCSNGFVGYEGANEHGFACCPIGCTKCGGSECGTIGASLGLDSTACCVNGVLENRELCSIAGTAPCVIDGETVYDEPRINAAVIIFVFRYNKQLKLRPESNPTSCETT